MVSVGLGEKIVTVVEDLDSVFNGSLVFNSNSSCVVVEVDSEGEVLLDDGVHVGVEEEFLAESEVGSDVHVLGELAVSSRSESDGSVHELLDVFLPTSGEHASVSHGDLGQGVSVVVGNGSEFVFVGNVTPDSAVLVNVVLTFKSKGIDLFFAEVVLESDSSTVISVT